MPGSMGSSAIAACGRPPPRTASPPPACAIPPGAPGPAGQQVEGRVRYWIFPAALRLEVNAVVLFKAGLLLDAPNAPRTGNTRHVAVSLTQTF